MNLTVLKRHTKLAAIIGLLALVVVAESCNTKGVYGRSKGGKRGCDCPGIGH